MFAFVKVCMVSIDSHVTVSDWPKAIPKILVIAQGENGMGDNPNSKFKKLKFYIEYVNYSTSHVRIGI